jgi:phosphate-selective porin
MRKLGFLMAAGMLVAPLASPVQAEDARVYYKNGTNLEFPTEGVNVKLNEQIQVGYSYNDYEDARARGMVDTNSFDVVRARLAVSGSALDGDLGFKLQNDFVGNSEADGRADSDLRDAWLEYRADDMANVRMGQYKTPFSVQELTSSAALQLVSRSIVVDELAVDRQQGVMLHGESDGLTYALSATNGETAGEGINQSGVDNKLGYAGMVTYSANGYDRSHEGDVKGTDGVAWTAGGAITYHEGASGDADTIRYNADLGLRANGLSAQAEFIARSVQPTGGSDVDDSGYYVQLGYFVVPETWEVAGRFSSLMPESDLDVTEYTVGLNRYLSGHNVKVQTGVTFVDTDGAAGSSTTDVRFDVLATAYL